MKRFKLKAPNIKNSFKKLKLSEASLWKVRQTDDYKILMNLYSFFPLMEGRIYKDIERSHLNMMGVFRVLTKNIENLPEYSEMINRMEEKLYDQADLFWYIAFLSGQSKT